MQKKLYSSQDVEEHFLPCGHQLTLLKENELDELLEYSRKQKINPMSKQVWDEATPEQLGQLMAKISFDEIKNSLRN